MRSEKSKRKILRLVLPAVFAALSIVLGKFLQIPVGDSIRISFENTSLLMAGILFGPWVGAATGAVADLVGSMIMGYTIIPVITVGAALIGLVSGFCFRLTGGRRAFVSLFLCVIPAHVIGSMVVKTLGLALYFSTPWEILALRVPIYLVIGSVETYIIMLLLRSSFFSFYLSSNDANHTGIVSDTDEVPRVDQ